MGLKFNPFLVGNFQFDSSGGSISIGNPVVGADPSAILVTDSDSKLSDIVLNDGQILIGSTGNAPVATAIDGTPDQVVVTSGPGSIVLSTPQDIASTSSPTFAGLTIDSLDGPLKASAGIVSAGAIDLTSEVTGILPIENGGTGIDASSVSNGNLLIGSGSGFVLGSISGTTDQVNITVGAGTIAVSLPQDIVTTSSPTFANLNLNPSGSIDTTTVGTLAIGTGNADIINIGNSGATINIQGDTIYQNVTDLNVTDKKITLNNGGSIGSASDSGIEIEENSVITAYVTTSSDRNSFQIKAPAQTGVITLSPGASGFTINQGSHDPITLAAVGSSPNANGASLSSQVLTLQPADGTNPGLLTALAQNIAGNKTFLNTISLSDISSNIIPTTTTQTLGNATNYWSSLAVTNVFSPFNQGIDFSDGRMVDSNGDTQIQFNSIGVSLAQLTESTVPYLDASKLLKSSAVTPTELEYVSGVTSAIQTQLDSKVDKVTGDIAPTSYALVNNSSQSITGLAFANTVSSFEAFLNIQIDATVDTYTTMKLVGTRKDTTWATNDLTIEFAGDPVPQFSNITIQSSGQITISIGNITGFVSGSIKFRAITV